MNTNVLGDFRSQYPQPSDDQLLSEAKAGNGRAFAELCRRHTSLLKQRIFRVVRHREDMEDVLQETFMNAFRHLHSFQGHCTFATWMTKIGINASLMLLRKRKTGLKYASPAVMDDGQRVETVDCPDPSPNPEQRYMMNQTYRRIKRAICELPPRLHSMVDLYYRQECPLKDAAKAVGMSEPAAKSALMRARKFLRRSLKGQSHPCRSALNRH